VLPPVAEAVEQIRKAFPDAVVEVREDGSGGAYVLIESVTLGPKYTPQNAWMGGHIPPQFPYADIYPVFIGGEARFASGAPFVAPITPGHTFCGRSALQVSRKTNRLDPTLQTAACKFMKVLFWLTQQG
jgi:hypothetical protein